MFYKLSPESVHYRFFRMIKAMPHEKLQDFLRVDYDADMALVVATDSAADAEIVAIAHYGKDPRTNFAEAAFLVRDDWQGRGIGTILLNTLADVARSHGIAGFAASVLAPNHGMLRVFHKCGYPVESELDDGVYHLKIPFETGRKARMSRAGKAEQPG
jgi:GNAT superfamily N-acetyltransferase